MCRCCGGRSNCKKKVCRQGPDGDRSSHWPLCLKAAAVSTNTASQRRRRVVQIMRHTLVLVGVITVATTLSAQRPETGERQPTAPDHPDLAAEWIAGRDGTTQGAEAVITAQGPTVRITAPVAATVLRTRWTLAGNFDVTATFQRASADQRAEYGLTVGGRSATALACVVRSDGAFAIHRGPLSTAPAQWTVVNLKSPPSPTMPTADRLTLRVSGTVATCLVNGQDIISVTVGAGDLVGPPGVYVGSANTVDVSGFSIEGFAAPVLTPGR